MKKWFSSMIAALGLIIMLGAGSPAFAATQPHHHDVVDAMTRMSINTWEDKFGFTDNSALRMARGTNYSVYGAAGTYQTRLKAGNRPVWTGTRSLLVGEIIVARELGIDLMTATAADRYAVAYELARRTHVTIVAVNDGSEPQGSATATIDTASTASQSPPAPPVCTNCNQPTANAIDWGRTWLYAGIVAAFLVMGIAAHIIWKTTRQHWAKIWSATHTFCASALAKLATWRWPFPELSALRTENATLRMELYAARTQRDHFRDQLIGLQGKKSRKAPMLRALRSNDSLTQVEPNTSTQKPAEPTAAELNEGPGKARTTRRRAEKLGKGLTGLRADQGLAPAE